MKNFLFIMVLGFVFGFSPMSAQVDTVAVLTVPAVGEDSVECITPDLSTSPVYFADYSDLDGDVYLKFGPDPGDGKYQPWYLKPKGTETEVDSILLDAGVVSNKVDGVAYYRTAITKDFPFKDVCFEIYNSGATAGKKVYIFEN